VGSVATRLGSRGRPHIKALYRGFFDAESDTAPTDRMLGTSDTLLDPYADLTELDDDAIEGQPMD
jgi:hypothetical protein